jgi:hypothetical protein
LLNSKWVVVLLLLVAPGLGACGAAGIVPPAVSAPNGEPAEGGVIEGQATVDSIEVVTAESFPVQVLVIVRGNLPDGCTQLGDPVVQVTGSTFMMTLPTTRMADAPCTEALTPFEMPFPLDVVDLPAGSYTVDVHGVTGTFTLDADNWLPTDSLAGCPVAGADQLPYANQAAGYCLLYPTDFAVLEYATGIIIQRQPYGFPEPRLPFLNLEVSDAANQTAGEVADGLVAEVADLVGLEISRSDIVVGGQQAVVLDGLPGQDFNRQVLVVREGQLYKLVFSYSEPGPDFEHLYDVIVSSFTFLPAT